MKWFSTIKLKTLAIMDTIYYICRYGLDGAEERINKSLKEEQAKQKFLEKTLDELKSHKRDTPFNKGT